MMELEIMFKTGHETTYECVDDMDVKGPFLVITTTTGIICLATDEISSVVGRNVTVH
jgi:hypothetical protein